MSQTDRIVLTCTCEGTMAPDVAAMARAACGDGSAPVHQLCRAQADRYREALATGRPITVACTQEAPLFCEMAEAAGATQPIAFANIRETAGWTEQAADSAPKMAALLAMAAEAPGEFSFVTMESRGVVLILGRDETAVEAGHRLADSLNVTVLLAPGAEVTPPGETVFPVMQGRVRTARGHLGAFDLTIDATAAALPSSRRVLAFGPGRDGATSQADLVVDLTGAPPLFPAPDQRPGYLRADPRDSVAVERALRQAAGLVGTFDKPRFIDFRADLCAHTRNRITGCTRCLNLCPTGAIAPAGDSVAIDPFVCAGCGQCAAACPTGAAAYVLPATEALARRLRAGLRAYHAAGARRAPVVLFHDADHGRPLVEAAGRFGRGLPAQVIPVAVNEVTQIGPGAIAAAHAWGAAAVLVLARSRPAHDPAGLVATLSLMAGVAQAAGLPVPELIDTDDPDMLEAALHALPPEAPRAGVSSFLPPADERGLLVTAVAEMLRTAPLPPAAALPVPADAPFGTIVVDTAACTLCHACTGACPAGALSDTPDRPELRFTESACVQCGICSATCPEKAITLVPQIDTAAWDAPRRLLHSEEPFACTDCGKLFGTKSGIARIQSRLSAHWMFTGDEAEKRLALLTKCEDCRVRAVVADGFDPHGEGQRRVRTADDFR
ncbi:MAG TPA: 4Fe-4S binding protein [Paracoccaceae bacterium]|nr:4Fe-4S binding protein [Paracoccaceae bacterium]HMO70366.1 4Fe-4S binding protein [Paracoccaceae bacterium]